MKKAKIKKITVKAKEHDKKIIEINTPFIKLDNLLKFEGLAESGGQAKFLIQNEQIKLNGEICTSRGKKVKEGDIVSFDNTDYTIVTAQKAEKYED